MKKPIQPLGTKYNLRTDFWDEKSTKNKIRPFAVPGPCVLNLCSTFWYEFTFEPNKDVSGTALKSGEELSEVMRQRLVRD